MAQPLFVSYAQNGEDVVLWRALRDVTDGRYVEVGANHPTDLSISKAFYDRGWRGVTIDPVQSFADQHRAQRPRDTFVRAAVTDGDETEVTLNEFPDTGLSTLDQEITDRHEAAGLEHRTVTVPAERLDTILERSDLRPDAIHFMTIDTEGSEAAVLSSLDLTTWRPWILVVESTAPLATAQTHGAWEPALVDAGYVFCLFDGLSRFYVAQEHADRLRDRLTYPACPLDEYVRTETLAADRRIDQLTKTCDATTAEVIRWRTEAVAHWTRALDAPPTAETEDLRREVAQLRHDLLSTRATLSWRVTAPLRLAGRLRHRGV